MKKYHGESRKKHALPLLDFVHATVQLLAGTVAPLLKSRSGKPTGRVPGAAFVAGASSRIPLGRAHSASGQFPQMAAERQSPWAAC